MLDGQLDSCDLTFADLERIQDAFLRCLVSMYHHRVDYPGFDFGKAKPEAREPKETKEGKTDTPAEDAAASFPDRKLARGS